jgi:hypothetical protein
VAKTDPAVPPPVPRKPASTAEALQFNPKSGKLPAPEAMAMYAAIDPEFPAFLRETFTLEQKRNFTYQMTTLSLAIGFASLLAGLAAFMAYTEHPRMALAFLGTNVLGIAVKILAKSTRPAQ